jgi:GAF domain-containing protein
MRSGRVYRGIMAGKQPTHSNLGARPRLPDAGALRLLLETGIHLVEADEGSLLVYEPAKRVLRFAMTAGDRAAERGLIGQTVPVGKGLTGLAAVTGEVQVGAPTYHDIEQKQRRGGKSEPEAEIAAPIVAGETLLGVMTAVSFRAGRRFSQKDGRIMSRFGAIAGLVLEQHRRLVAAEGAGERGDAGTGRSERAIVAAVAKVRRERPEALPGLARAIGAITAMILIERESGDEPQ